MVVPLWLVLNRIFCSPGCCGLFPSMKMGVASATALPPTRTLMTPAARKFLKSTSRICLPYGRNTLRLHGCTYAMQEVRRHHISQIFKWLVLLVCVAFVTV